MHFASDSHRAAGEPARTMLCLSHLRWNFVFQRPQHLLTRAARRHDVLFFEEPVHAEVSEARLDITRSEEGVTVVVPVLPHGTDPETSITLQRRLLDGLLAERGSGPDILWYYTPMALPFTDHLQPDLIVYDNMDELSAFRGAPPEMIRSEQRLMERADIVFTGGHSLYRAKRGRHANLHAFPSSIDVAHFDSARHMQGAEPDDQRAIAHPRLGFFGVIDERMDIDLVGRIAELRPDWQLVMIGPVVKIDPASLPQRANIHWLGGKHYRDLPAYLAGWDLGVMPFALNESTRFISPTKTPEFLAAGLPVVSTEIEDVVRPYGESGLVEIAGNAEEFVARAEMLLARPRQPWLAEVDAYLSTISWDRTWEDMTRLMEASRRSNARTSAATELKEAAYV